MINLVTSFLVGAMVVNLVLTVFHFIVRNYRWAGVNGVTAAVLIVVLALKP